LLVLNQGYGEGPIASLLSSEFLLREDAYMLIMATPHNGNLNASFITSRDKLIIHISKQRAVMPVFTKDAHLSQGRNRLFEMAYRNECDLLFIDSDMEFEPSAYDELVKTPGEVITAVCHKRSYPYTPCVFNINCLNQLQHLDNIPNRIFKLDAAGMAFCLIRKKAIQAFSPEAIKIVGKPFNHSTNKDGNELEEDMSFCMRLKTLGIDIWANPFIRVGHISERAIYRDDYEIARRNGG
jgi:hypothetical protein